MSVGITWELLSNLDGEFYEGWRELAREQTGTWRWGVTERRIIEREADHKCFEVNLQIQTGDEGPGYSRSSVIPIGAEVRPVERITISWEPVEVPT